MDTPKISFYSLITRFYKLIKKSRVFFLVVLLSLPGVFPLLKSGFFPTQDGDNLLIRFADFNRSILDFLFPPRWAGYLNHTFGYPVLIFLYPGLLYIWEGIHSLGFGLLTSVKISLFFSIFASGIFMYLFVKEVFGKWPALISGIFYIYFPYRFVDIYLRGSFGEALAFLFVPLIFWTIIKFIKSQQKKYLILGSISLATLITVHNVQALIFLPLILFFMAVMLFSQKDKKRKPLFFHFLLFLVLSLGLSCFFWLPALLERKFTVFDTIKIAGFSDYFLDIKHLFFFHKTIAELPLQIGLLHFSAGLLSLLFLAFIKNKKQKIISVFFRLSFFFSFFIMTDVSYKLCQLIKIDRFLQFPWRFLGFNAFSSSFLIALPVFLLKRKLKLVFCVFLVLAVIFNSLPYIKPLGFLYRDDNFYTTNDATTTSSNEYLPIWVKEPPTQAPAEKIEIEEGEIEVKEYKTHKRIFIVNTEQTTKVKINTLYFPGWQILVDGEKVEIDYKNNNGMLAFEVPEGEHQILARFTETPLRKMANFISLGSLFFIVIILFNRKNETIFT